MIRLLLAGAAPQSLLALTFTRKAAAEMRQRLQTRLHQLALLDDADLITELTQLDTIAPNSKPDSTLLNRARCLYEELLFADQGPRVTTFHAFCQEILRRFPIEARVPAGYELLDSGGLIEQMAWDALMLETSKQPNSKLMQALEHLFLECNGLQNTKAALLRGFLAHRSDWWAYTEDQAEPTVYASDQLQQWLQPKPDPIADFFNETNGNLLREVADLIGKHPIQTNLQRCAAISNGLNDSYAVHERFAFIESAFLTKDKQAKKIKASKTLAQKIGAAAQERYLHLNNTITDQILATGEQLLRRTAFYTNVAWYTAGAALLKHYQKIKSDQHLLDFADLEWKTYQLLNNSEHALWVQYKLDQKIDHLLLDEFQDTNPTQWRLLLPLLEELASGNEQDRERSVFLVGDSKQSIYRFRRANPQLQSTASDWLEQNLAAQQLSLSKSWRSAPAIIDFINAVFTQSDTPLATFTDHATHQTQAWGQVEILPPVLSQDTAATELTGLRDPLQTQRQANESDAHYREGQLIAAKIKSLLEQKISIKKNARQQALDYSDIMLLLRSRTHSKEYERALVDAAIPFIGIDKGGLLESPEIQDLVALLSCLITPFNNLALAQVLRSPIINAGDKDLQTLAAAHKQQHGHWYDCLLQLPTKSPALKRAAELLPRWRDRVNALPVHDLIDRIYYEGDLINRYRQAGSDMIQAQLSNNLQRVLDLALQIDSGRYPSIIRFLMRLKQWRTIGVDAPDTPALADAAPKVCIMTIHAAKGLEAPVVFLADTGAAQTAQQSYSALIDWPTKLNKPQHMLLYTRAKQCPSQIAALREKALAEEQREEANLLYVAISRAQHALFISAASNNEKRLQNSWYEQLETAMQKLSKSSCHTKNVAPTYHAQTYRNDENTLLAAPSSRPFPDRSAVTPAQVITDTNNNQARERGIVQHKLIELLSPPNAVAAIDATQHNFNIDKDQLTKLVSDSKKLIAKPEFAFIFDPAIYNKAYKEQAITYQDKHGETAYGIIDRLIEYQEEIWIIDFKTQQAVDDDSAQAQPFTEQLTYYEQGVKEIWPDKKIRKAILFTATEQLAEL